MIAPTPWTMTESGLCILDADGDTVASWEEDAALAPGNRISYSFICARIVYAVNMEEWK
jgi:hypothetical protein